MHELTTDKFKLVAGDTSLDFINTVFSRPKVKGPADPNLYSYGGDKFTCYLDLVSWAYKAGLLSLTDADVLLRRADAHPREAEKILKRAVALREVLYRLFRSLAGKWEPAEKDTESFNAEIALSRKHEKLEYISDNRLEWVWDDLLPDKMLWIISKTAANLLASEKVSKIKGCAGEQCGWLFLDESRSRNRQWCDMKDCGNIAKVRRFRERKAAV